MFHRQNQKTDMAEQSEAARPQQTSPNAAPAAKDQSPTEVYAKTEKEKSMFQNQPNNTPASETEGETAKIDIPGNPAGLQRPMQPPRMPGAFPGSYATAPGAGYNPTPGKSTDGRRLVVGEGISLSGEIESCDVLIVEGTIEAALKGAKILDIAESGVFYGTVNIDDATIAGRFEGDLTVNGRLTVRATGSITGSVSYKELAVEAGAVLDGKIVPLSGSKADKKSDRPSQQVRKQATRNDNSGNELPFAASSAQG